MPTTEWLNKYEAIKDKLTCKDDLEAHFTEKVIGNMAVDVLDRWDRFAAASRDRLTLQCDYRYFRNRRLR